MTREEAIRRLKNMAWLYGSVEREPHIEAIDMAIEALSADAVSSDGVIAYMCDGRKCGGDCDNCGRTTDIEHAKNFTRISDSYFERLDSVAVVRCKDCRWYSKGENDSDSWALCTVHIGQHIGVDDDEFCSYGERREP